MRDSSITLKEAVGGSALTYRNGTCMSRTLSCTWGRGLERSYERSSGSHTDRGRCLWLWIRKTVNNSRDSLCLLQCMALSKFSYSFVEYIISANEIMRNILQLISKHSLSAIAKPRCNTNSSSSGTSLTLVFTLQASADSCSPLHCLLFQLRYVAAEKWCLAYRSEKLVQVNITGASAARRTASYLLVLLLK